MGFSYPLFLSLVALCITPSGESNIFPVTQLWHVNAHCIKHDPSGVASIFPELL